MPRPDPSHAELLAWWRHEQQFEEFNHTPVGQHLLMARQGAYFLWREHQAYQRTVLDHYERMPLASTILPPKP